MVRGARGGTAGEAEVQNLEDCDLAPRRRTVPRGPTMLNRLSAVAALGQAAVRGGASGAPDSGEVIIIILSIGA